MRGGGGGGGGGTVFPLHINHTRQTLVILLGACKNAWSIDNRSSHAAGKL